jgi:hypothetical protein
MATRETVRDMPPVPQAPEDTSVIIPQSVKAASDRASAIHAAAYQTPAPPVDPNAQPQPEPQPQPQPQPEPQPDQIDDPFALAAPVVQPALQPAPQPAPVVQSAPQPQPQPEQPTDPENAPFDPNLTAAQYHHRYASMYGRWRATSATLTDMQEQMVAMSDALSQVQQRPQQPAPLYAQPGPTTPLVTDEDRSTFGTELIDLATRAAKQALAPELAALKSENSEVRQRLQQSGQQSVQQALDGALPNWREINRSTQFKAWLGLRDLYSGQVRHGLLNAAFTAADAPRVVAFFKGFVQDGIATGSIPQPPVPGVLPLQPQPQLRQPAVSLDSLAAPGRARPASGDNPAQPVEKPVFTRTQIKAFYEAVRRGDYAGQDTLKNTHEQMIFAAQRDNRVR